MWKCTYRLQSPIHIRVYLCTLMLYIIGHRSYTDVQKRQISEIYTYRLIVYNWQPNKHIDKMRRVYSGTAQYIMYTLYTIYIYIYINTYLRVFMSTQKPLVTRFIPRTKAPTYLDGFQAWVGIFPRQCNTNYIIPLHGIERNRKHDNNIIMWPRNPNNAIDSAGILNFMWLEYNNYYLLY